MANTGEQAKTGLPLRVILVWFPFLFALIICKYVATHVPTPTKSSEKYNIWRTNYGGFKHGADTGERWRTDNAASRMRLLFIRQNVNKANILIDIPYNQGIFLA